eukprot:EG_transcript_17751
MYWDGSCELCKLEVKHYQGIQQSDVKFVDISALSPTELKEQHGLDKTQAMFRLHARAADGRVVTGAAAFVEVWKGLPGFRWLGACCERVPGVLWLMELGYSWWAPRRQRIAAAYTNYIATRRKASPSVIQGSRWLAVDKELAVTVHLPNTPVDQAFDLIADPNYLDVISPIGVTPLPSPVPVPVQPGQLIAYVMRLPFLSFVPVHWTTHVTVVDPPSEITYEQRRGPYASFLHIHRLQPAGGGTRVQDVVRYRLPGGWPGGLLLHHGVQLWLRYIFQYRNAVLLAADALQVKSVPPPK